MLPFSWGLLMEPISFSCTSCRQVVKVGADQVGHRTRCQKCGTELIVPQSQAKSAPAKGLKPAADDEEEGGAYGVVAVEKPAPAVETKTQKKPKDKKPVVRRKLKKKSVQDADQWQKLLIALWFMFGGACVWAICWLLQTIMVLQGLLTVAMYSPMQLDLSRDREDGQFNLAAFAIGLIVNRENLDAGKAFYITLQALFLAAGGCFLAGYCICLGVPSMYGTRGQTIVLLIMGVINMLVTLLMKLLPVAGAVSYAMVPLIAPEVALNVSNLERTVPLHVFWSNSPFWELFGTVLLQAVFFGEPILFCVFLRSTAMAVKDDQWLEPKAQGLLRLGFGQFFLLLTFYLMSITGTSEVVGWTLLVIYIIWRCFLVGYIISFALAMFQARVRLAGMLSEDEED